MNDTAAEAVTETLRRRVPKRAHDAAFGDHWLGPVFPDGIERLQEAYDHTDDREWLEAAALDVDGFHEVHEPLVDPQTRDGYVWRVAHVFEKDGIGKIAVFFPRKRGGISERHCAVYVQTRTDGQIPYKLLAQLVTNFAESLPRYTGM